MFLEISQNSQENTCNVIKKDTLAQVFSCKFCEISKNTFFTEHLWKTASENLTLQAHHRSTYTGLLLKFKMFTSLSYKISLIKYLIRWGYTVKYSFQSISWNVYFMIVSLPKLPINVHDILFEAFHEIWEFWKSIFRIFSFVKDLPIEFVFMLG